MPVLMTRPCTCRSSNGELKLWRSSVLRDADMGFDELFKLCLCSRFKEESIENDTEGSGQTMAA